MLIREQPDRHLALCACQLRDTVNSPPDCSATFTLTSSQHTFSSSSLLPVVSFLDRVLLIPSLPHSRNIGRYHPGRVVEVVMLASVPQMDTVRSLPRNPGAPMRQPSAEDLDAAQQLISSAQAGREHLAEQYSDGPRVKVSGSPTPNYGPGQAPASLVDGLSNGQTQEKASPRGQRDTSFLGHSCR